MNNCRAYSKIGLIHFHKEEFLKARDAFKASLEAEESAEAKRLLERTENILGDVSRVWFDSKVHFILFNVIFLRSFRWMTSTTVN